MDSMDSMLRQDAKPPLPTHPETWTAFHWGID